ncbi:MAG: GNAT family N-acetyltransferase [Oscillospiraceae bacterium]|nr:GNAT family N-acetyltransferase [Oscillospiraceae bacterium]
MLNHKGTITLETERLILRRFHIGDADAMFRNWANSNLDIAKYLDWNGSTFNTINNWIVAYEKDDSYNWAIVLKDLGEPIGYINAHDIDDLRNMLEIGYAIGEKFWHKGIATEAARKIIAFFFEDVKVNRIAAKHNSTNPRSGGVMRKVGMSFEGTQRQASRTGCDVVLYALLAEDYFNKSQAVSNSSTIKESLDLMFHNLKIAMDTVDWNAEVCGAPAWRYIYHTLHSADKWFINPSKRNEEPEPPFHTPGLDWPDTPSTVVLSRETLYTYYEQVRQKILDYCDSWNDSQLCEQPQGCVRTRLGLALSQFRHIYAHIGILNGVTIVNTNRYPRVINEGTWHSRKFPEGLYDVEDKT